MLLTLKSRPSSATEVAMTTPSNATLAFNSGPPSEQRTDINLSVSELLDGIAMILVRLFRYTLAIDPLADEKCSLDFPV